MSTAEEDPTRRPENVPPSAPKKKGKNKRKKTIKEVQETNQREEVMNAFKQKIEQIQVDLKRNFETQLVELIAKLAAKQAEAANTNVASASTNEENK